MSGLLRRVETPFPKLPMAQSVRLDFFQYICMAMPCACSGHSRLHKNNNSVMKTESDNVFRVTKSKTVRAVTAATWVIVAAVFAAAWWAFLAEPFHPVAFAVMLAVTVFALVVLFYYYFISPLSVELAADALVLRRVLGRKVFRYADIEAAGLFEGKGSDMFRFCGSGAFCGFIGWFSGGGLGCHFEYVGRYSDAFWLRLRGGRTYLLSCDGSRLVVSRVLDAMEEWRGSMRPGL